MNEENKTVFAGERKGVQTFISCDYGAALIMSIYKNGDVSDLSLNGQTMDAICETWLAYRASVKERVEPMKWKRYRFYTRSADDPRPLVFNPAYPWWCSGYTGDGSSAIIVAYLPADEPLEKYWNDAFDVEHTEEETITFSDRFPKPEYYQEQKD